MSRSLIKIVDLSLFPAAVLILGKIAGIFLAVEIFNIRTGIDSSIDILSLGPTVSPKDLQILTSYSDLFMYIFVVTYFSVILIRAIFLHDSHIKPTLAAKLAQKNLLKLVQTSYQIYHFAITALVFLWLATALTIFNTLLGNTFVWVGVTVFVASIILTTMLVQDVYREIENIKHKPGQYNWS